MIDENCNDFLAFFHSMPSRIIASSPLSISTRPSPDTANGNVPFSVPHDQFDAVLPAVEERKHVSGEWVVSELIPDDGAKSIVRLSEIDKAPAQEDTLVATQAQHAGSRAFTTRLRWSALNSTATRMRIPEDVMISTGEEPLLGESTI